MRMRITSPTSHQQQLQQLQQQLQRLQRQSQNYHSSPRSAKIESNNDKLTQAEMEQIMDEAVSDLHAEQQAKLNTNFTKPIPGQRKKPLVLAHSMDQFQYEHDPQTWLPQSQKRCGALAIKLGMMPVWDQWGERHACTVLFIDSNVVLSNFTMDKDGYIAVQIGAGARKIKNTTKPLLGHFLKCGVGVDGVDGVDTANTNTTDSTINNSTINNPSTVPYVVKEFRLTHEEYMLDPGTQIHASHFTPGQNIDVSATSKGKGFQGAMKRWNFKGMPATHGTSKSHRSLGSTGQCQDPGRVFKGKKMAGRMGGDRVTTQNLRIVKIDRGRNLLYVKGPVPGQKGHFCEIRDAIKKPLFGTDKVRGEVRFPPLPTFDYETTVDGTGQAGHELMMPQQVMDPFDPPEEAA